MIRLFVLLPLLAAAALLIVSLDTVPLVRRDGTISPASIAEARLLLTSNDPRRLRPGDQRTAQIPVALIDQVVNHFATRTLQGRGAFTLVDDVADCRVSIPVPGLPGPRYLNLRVAFQDRGGQMRLASASLGSLPIPPALAEWLIVAAIDLAGVGEQWRQARLAVRGLALAPTRGLVIVTYVWDPGLFDLVRSFAFTPAETRHAEAAQRTLAGLLSRYPTNARVPLSEVLPPLLAGASGDGTLPQRRAALLVLAIYVSEKSLSTLLPQARGWPRPRQLRLTLLGRFDSAQHFGISAALAAWAGEPAANAIGVYKEIDDSRHGSGFSFADLAADRAGTRFGELLAANSPILEQALRAPLSDADLVPTLAGLPEYLSEAEFRRRYGSGDNAAYRQVSKEIEDRLAALPLYR